MKFWFVFIALCLVPRSYLWAQEQCRYEINLDDVTRVSSESVSLGRALCRDAPVYDIHRRSKVTGYGEYFDGVNSETFYKEKPFARFRPSPFFYKSDVEEAEKTDTKPFLVAGVNCDKTIQQAKTITGTSLATLSLRARGDFKNRMHATADYVKKFGENKNGSVDYTEARPEWAGEAQPYARTSGDGFLDRKYVYKDGETAQDRKASEGALRNLLLQDNRRAGERKLTHQKIAEPILKAIEGRIFNKTKKFQFQGNWYSISSEIMSEGFLCDPKEKNCEPQTKPQDSGWTGKGRQGSFFDDEIFGSQVFTIRKLDGAGKPQGKLVIDAMTPHLIYRYGFYQGGPYRVSPDTIADFFKITPEKKDPWSTCN